jgi:hypothetical protein
MGRASEIRRISRWLARSGLTVLLAATVLAAAAPAGKAYIYWTDSGPAFGGTAGTTVERVNNDGRGLKTLVKNASSPQGIVRHGPYIYWANTGTFSVGRASTSGAGANPKFISAGEAVNQLAVDSHYIYWSGSGDWVSRANLDGSHIIADCVYLGASIDGITVSGGLMYIGQFQEIDRASATCGATPHPFVTLTRSQASANALTVGGPYLYWSEVDIFAPPPASSIGRVQLDGSSPDENFVPSLRFPGGVAIFGGNLYWTDNGGGPAKTGAIGHEQVGSQNPNNDFIIDGKGPGGIVVDGLIDPTSTTVSCTPTRVAKGNATVCTAVVHDSASSELPAGTVLFHGPTSVFFPGGNACTLTKRPTGGAGCTVGAESSVTGKHVVSASYKGNPTHRASTGSATFCVGSKTLCK